MGLASFACGQKPGGCPVGWDAMGSSCYKLFASSKTWQDAEDHCQKEGGHLTSIHSPEEQNLVVSLHSGSFWAGGSDLDTEGNWKWTDNTSLSFTDWRKEEPNGEETENCLELIRVENSFWNDRQCSDPLYFICKISSGLAPSYVVSSSGGLKENYPAYLGLYKKTDQLANFPGECNPNLPIFKQESGEYYLFVNCNNDWILSSRLHHDQARAFADKSSTSDAPPSTGWKYWQSGDLKTDSTMRVAPDEAAGTICITDSGPSAHEPCIFPFKFRGVTYTGCTWVASDLTDSKPWCSTMVNETGHHIGGKGKWGNCAPGCPIPPDDRPPTPKPNEGANNSAITTSLTKTMATITTTDCRTVSGPVKDAPCLFPFTYQGEEYHECSTADYGGKLWCSTQTDQDGNYVAGKWGVCGDSCRNINTTIFDSIGARWSYIVDSFTGLYLTAKDSSSLETRAYDGSANQLWSFDADERILNQGSGLVIDGSGSRPTLKDASPTTNTKQWKLRTDIKSSQESDSIVPKLATDGGKGCLNTANRFLENGAPVIMYLCSGVHPDNAGWTIVSSDLTENQKRLKIQQNENENEDDLLKVIERYGSRFEDIQKKEEEHEAELEKVLETFEMRLEDLQNETKDHESESKKIIERLKIKLEDLQNKEEERKVELKHVSKKYDEHRNENWIWRPIFLILFIFTGVGVAVVVYYFKNQLILLKDSSDIIKA